MLLQLSAFLSFPLAFLWWELSSLLAFFDSRLLWASLVAQTVKTLPEMQETQVRSLGREDPPRKGMAIHSNILAWRIPWTEEPAGL